MRISSDDMLSSINNSFEHDAHDLEGNSDGTDLDFIYNDVDTYQNEIAELYSYTEFNEFQLNVKAFEDQMEMYDLPPSWQKQNSAGKRSIVMKLVDQLEVSNRAIRMQAARCILYLAQGCWVEVQSDEEQQAMTRENVLLLYELGVFSSFIDLLNMEIESACSPDIVAIKITNITLVDSMDLRVILSVLYIITETIREERNSEDYKQTVEAFIGEINSPQADGELLAVKLLTMITRFCSGAAPHFPMKKVLLLLWKITLVGLGGMDVLRDLKNEYRIRAGLEPNTEDTIEITRYMRASSPPATATDILDNQNPKRNVFRRSLIKQRFFDEHEQMEMEMSAGNENGSGAGGEEELSQYYRPYEDPSSSTQVPDTLQNLYSQPLRSQPMQYTRLPWQPKVRQKDIDQFLDISRNKFIGYSLIDDHESLAGLPEPIHEGVKTLRRHMYVSLADIQIKKEEEIARNPISTEEDDIQMTPAETLYQAILPNLPQYMIALLKVLLAASPTSKSKTESINIMADVLPKKMPITSIQTARLSIDMGRHKEIIVKAVSAVILLYLKHFKINHIYQFEFMSQHLVFANCIPLVLKFFNQNITDYVEQKNVIPLLDFPSCVIGEQPDLSEEGFVYAGDMSDKPYTWRNVFSCINLLRILNKLIKWKHSRVMMLVVFKSAPILKKTLKVRHAMMQLYVLKLLKMQTKYLGRQWRKSNMKTMSAIYAKVRHRLNDDWAFGNDLESRPWDFQAEECTLRACVDRFNLRRYPEASQKCGSGSGNNGHSGNSNENSTNLSNNIGPGGGSDSNGFGSVGVSGSGGGFGGNTANNIGNTQSQLIDCGVEGGFPSDEILTHSDFAFFGHSGWWDRKVELSDYFKANYAIWLEEEVYNSQTDWDAL